jgi:hypothetical protein
MSHFLDRLTFFRRIEDRFAGGHGIVTNEDRGWEDGYRKRWQHDKIVRSTHGANCTGSCSWKIYVKVGSSPGRRSRPIIRAPVPICRTTNRAAARAARASPGIFIPPTG